MQGLEGQHSELRCTGERWDQQDTWEAHHTELVTMESSRTPSSAPTRPMWQRDTEQDSELPRAQLWEQA